MTKRYFFLTDASSRLMNVEARRHSLADCVEKTMEPRTCHWFWAVLAASAVVAAPCRSSAQAPPEHPVPAVIRAAWEKAGAEAGWISEAAPCYWRFATAQPAAESLP